MSRAPEIERMQVQDSRFRSDSKNTIDVYRSSLVMTAGGEMQVSEENYVEPELLNCLYRRGRRRLRDIQANCKVNVWLDKLRGVLHLSGSKASVAAAKSQIASLGGPRKPVSAAVWAELLRTRKLHSGAEAAVARIQLDSGCRIHVERSCQEVHLFGDPECVAKAEKLLNELEQQSIEEVVSIGSEPLDSSHLQEIANSYGVTLRTEKNHACILGLRSHVEKAVKALKEQIKNPKFQPKNPTPLATVAETQDTNKAFGYGYGAVNVVPNTGFPKNGSNANNAVRNTPCPTCKACPFCAACGHPIAFADSSDAFSFTTNGNNGYATPGMYLKMDNIQQGSGMWQQVPIMPYDGGNNGGHGESTPQMAFMMNANGQNMPVCFVPASTLPSQQ